MAFQLEQLVVITFIYNSKWYMAIVSHREIVKMAFTNQNLSKTWQFKQFSERPEITTKYFRMQRLSTIFITYDEKQFTRIDKNNFSQLF